MDPDIIQDALHGDSQYVLPDLQSTTLTPSGPTINSLSDHLLAPSSPRINPQAGHVISKIEDILESIINCLIEGQSQLVIPLKKRPKPYKEPTIRDMSQIRNRPGTETTTISFPGKTQHEAWKFSILLRILELSHAALVNGVVITKRDIYYRDPELFKRQSVVDQYVDDLAFTFGVEREALNVIAAAKGLVAGALGVMKRGGHVVDFSMENEGLSISGVKDIEMIDASQARWALVVEKEATFRALATSHYWRTSSAGPGIIITGKGYPDIQTRAFTRLLSQQHSTLPIFGLVDFDPDGLGILSTYKHGSRNLTHENKNLILPHLRWLGLRSSGIISTANSAEERDAQEQGLLRLSRRDRRRAIGMLEHENLQQDCEADWRRELQVMLMLNIKAEIQILNNSRSLTDYLDRQLSGV